jgi:hypothetical protein
MTIVPIAAHVHWDDVQGVWRLKASRQEKDTGGTKEWVPLVELAGSLADLLTALLFFWALQQPTTGDPDKVQAPIGDLAAAAALWATLTARAVIPSPVLVATEGYADVDPTLTVYDGTGDDWGVTP